jgi:Tfp pilus assembly protein PilX
MITTSDNSLETSGKTVGSRSSERGAALATAILMLGLLSAIAMTVLAVVQTESRVAGSDLKHTQAFYAAAAGIEKMTSDFSTLFARTSRPTTTQLNTIAGSPPNLTGEGFTFNQTIALDDTTLTAMRQTQGITNGGFPSVTIPSGPFSGLTASVCPYILNTKATSDQAEAVLTRQMNNYLIPIFQFGMFSDEDMEIHPGPDFTFNGRVHANGNLYLNGNVKFLAKVTTASEAVRDVLRNGGIHDGTVSFQVGTVNVLMSNGSVVLGPNVAGKYPGSPTGTVNPTWKTNSVAAAQTGVPNQFGGQLQTASTGVAPLRLPLQLDGNPTRDVIKRRMPNDDVTLSGSRYHSKAGIRILIDDEVPSSVDASGIPSTQGVTLSTFNPIPLPNVAVASSGGRALWRVRDDGTYNEQTTTPKSFVSQQNAGTPTQALTVRGIKPTTQSVTLNGTATKIPAGSGVVGRILIQIVDANGNTFDVTREILSMGMTEGEPNAIVMLQRPLWAAFTQGSRDASNTNNPALNGDPVYQNDLTDILNKTHLGADGEVNLSSLSQNSTYGYLTGIVDDTASGSQPQRGDTPGAAGSYNSIVPINIYNVREGRIKNALDANTVWERGMMSIMQINMRNLARWVDGVYNTNLLYNTGAVSTNIACPDGYIVYVSDRRGDKVKSEKDSAGATINTTNGMADNEDIYGPNGVLDVTSGTTFSGEDVIDSGWDFANNVAKKGSLQKDVTELPDPAALAGTSGADFAARVARAKTVAAWTNIDAADTANPKTRSKYFRRAVRLFNGENLQVTGGANKLSSTFGITVASENMIYIWGNYNTTGINAAPATGVSCLNDTTASCYYNGTQVPASIVADAFTPLSKTWFDSLGAMFPDDLAKRTADASVPGVTSETSMRAGIIAGNNLSAMAGSPDAGNLAAESRLCGGMHNFPRFLEDWNSRWNFVGSLIPLYHSTQAMGQYNADSTIYGPPVRNWAFDITFTNPNKLPPGTPMFQYIEPTAFRESF